LVGHPQFSGVLSPKNRGSNDTRSYWAPSAGAADGAAATALRDASGPPVLMTSVPSLCAVSVAGRPARGRATGSD
jgi:hypothetical protein